MSSDKSPEHGFDESTGPARPGSSAGDGSRSLPPEDLRADHSPPNGPEAFPASEDVDDAGDDSEIYSFGDGPTERWDADDPRRKNDCFAPPAEPCECHCLHCGRTFSSDEIWFQEVLNDPQGFKGFWMCPTPNCSGAGFTFDLFPTDPSHPANEGWHYDDEDEEEGFSADGDDEDAEEFWSEEALDDDDDEEDEEYDPTEQKYQELDDFFGDEDDDLEGEEWKYGLQPGERPSEPAWREDARHAWEEERRKYDEPDQRPRTLDWSHREDRKEENHRPFKDDDIPF